MEALYKNHHRWLETWLHRQLDCGHQAADLSQDTFEQVLRAEREGRVPVLRQPRAYLATIARRGFNPIVVILNNHGYTTERFLLEGSYNDVFNWQYHRIPEVLGTGLGLEVRTVAELDDALDRAWRNTSSFSLLNVHLEKTDRSPALERLTARMGEIVRGESSPR